VSSQRIDGEGAPPPPRFTCLICGRTLSSGNPIDMPRCLKEGHERWPCVPFDRIDSVAGLSPVESPPEIGPAKSSPEMVVQATGARRMNEGKLLMHLIPAEVVQELAAVLTRGAQKYGARNWEQGLTYSSTFDSLQRHLWAWWNGQDVDDESGLSHLTHALCNVAFLVVFVKRIASRRLPATLDDRPFREAGPQRSTSNG
jgi:Domain of unknown function (DUF5664)